MLAPFPHKQAVLRFYRAGPIRAIRAVHTCDSSMASYRTKAGRAIRIPPLAGLSGFSRYRAGNTTCDYSTPHAVGFNGWCSGRQRAQ